MYNSLLHYYVESSQQTNVLWYFEELFEPKDKRSSENYTSD
jgi:hypothetical protein